MFFLDPIKQLIYDVTLVTDTPDETAPTDATVTAVVNCDAGAANGGRVHSISVNVRGNRYDENNPPAVVIPPPSRVQGTSNLINIQATAEAIVERGEVIRIVITNPGFGYDDATPLAISIVRPPRNSRATANPVDYIYHQYGMNVNPMDDIPMHSILSGNTGQIIPAGVRAIATATVSNIPDGSGGTIQGAIELAISNVGSGYERNNPPTVIIAPPPLASGGTPAVAVAEVAANGTVTGINFPGNNASERRRNQGSMYNPINPPAVIISQPSTPEFADNSMPTSLAIRVSSQGGDDSYRGPDWYISHLSGIAFLERRPQPSSSPSIWNWNIDMNFIQMIGIRSITSREERGQTAIYHVRGNSNIIYRCTHDNHDWVPSSGPDLASLIKSLFFDGDNLMAQDDLGRIWERRGAAWIDTGFEPPTLLCAPQPKPSS